MSFLAFVLPQVALLTPTLLGVRVIGFLLVYLLPSCPVLVKAGGMATPEYVAEMQHRMSLDQPFHAQYAQYMSAPLHGDLGESSSTGRPVLVDFMQRLPVAIMYLGVIVEEAGLFTDPRHPSTRALLSSVPVADPDARREHFVLKGEIPIPIAVHVRCRLRARYPVAKPVCAGTRSEMGNRSSRLRPLPFGLTDANMTGKKHISLGVCRHSQGPALAAPLIGQPIRRQGSDASAGQGPRRAIGEAASQASFFTFSRPDQLLERPEATVGDVHVDRTVDARRPIGLPPCRS
ncbi:oligopeptide/dipeptide ABC transporter ATP-binding protein [Bradyrhizobium sp. LM2.7]